LGSKEDDILFTIIFQIFCLKILSPIQKASLYGGFFVDNDNNRDLNP